MFDTEAMFDVAGYVMVATNMAMVSLLFSPWQGRLLSCSKTGRSGDDGARDGVSGATRDTSGVDGEDGDGRSDGEVEMGEVGERDGIGQHNPMFLTQVEREAGSGAGGEAVGEVRG